MILGFEYRFCPDRKAISVLAVDPRSPACEAGLERGDEIISVDGLDTSDGDILAILQKKAGDRLDLVIRKQPPKISEFGPLRFVRSVAGSGRISEISFVLIELSEPSLIDRISSFFGQATTPPKPCGVGLGIATNSSRIIVTELVPGSSADKCGRIFPGDELIAIDEVEITGWELARVRARMVGPAKSEVRLRVQRPSEGDAPGAIIEVVLVRSHPPPTVTSPATAQPLPTAAAGSSSSTTTTNSHTWHSEIRFGGGPPFATIASRTSSGGGAAASPVAATGRFAGRGLALGRDEEDAFMQAAYLQSIAQMREQPDWRRSAAPSGDRERRSLVAALLAAHLDSPEFRPADRDPDPAGDGDEIGGGGAAAAERAAAFSQLPVARHRAGDAGGGMCAVCLAEMEDGEAVMRLPCLHLFHQDCIGPWVRRAGNCPVCKCRV
jgi:hypothetical protein